ncbi:hypothetical protein [Streptomyces sp. NBC_00140]|uniref:hypothetical protein n=1 Tax=Streptomyces sp. NBC_00140 TaxID=2975664 RepID=UPI0022547AFA|nr:hypothetical protein [Streptomyces sp. NBC_00140]MCX5336912.1 hypothetical protein [Streptomyces sp. NBC_00140]MCX5338395.1 hypothetical protein [Streptomyces sp. NBC_00140]
MSSDPNRNYERLAKEARARRAALSIALNDGNAKMAEISKGTWQRVERALEIRETNYVKIDNLLMWAPGSCIRVLEGGEPVEVDAMTGLPDVQTSQLPPEVREGEARDVVQLALIATTKGTTVEEIRDMSERIVRDLRERGLI